MEVSTNSSSNSYASVLNPSENPKHQQQIQNHQKKSADMATTANINDMNKENKIPSKKHTDKGNDDDQRTTTTTTTDKHPKENNTTASAESNEEREELDESGFVPVQSHTKKDKKLLKNKGRNNDYQRSDISNGNNNGNKSSNKPSSSASSNATNSGTAGTAKSDKPSRRRRDRNRARGEKATANSAIQSNHIESLDDKSGDLSADDKKPKFVEAPLPQVNPWVVSSEIFCLNFFRTMKSNIRSGSRAINSHF